MENKRLESLDAFRGFDMMFIMGFASVIVAICGLFPDGNHSFFAQQMAHADWHGLTFIDTIFPVFLFIAGISFPFSYAKQQSLGASRASIYGKIAKRAVILFVFGLIYGGFLRTLDFQNARYCSVLGRIGFAWAISAVLFVNCKRVTREIVAAVILVGYFLLLRFVVAPDAPAGADSYSLEGNIVGWVDRHLVPGKMYLGIFDPEGLFGTVPAVATAMLGMLTGEFVRESTLDGNKKTLRMLMVAAAMLVIGLVWSRWFPLNKNLWTSTFVLVVGAYSLAMFAIFYWIIDVKGHRKWAFPFKVIGMNSITIYMAMQLVSFMFTAEALFGGLAHMLPPAWAHLVIVTGAFLLRWLLLYFLYKKNIFLKV